MAAAIDEDEEFENISIEYIPEETVSLIEKTPSPPKGDIVSSVASMPSAPTNKVVVPSLKKEKQDRTDELIEIYLSKFQENQRNIALDYLEKASKYLRKRGDTDLANAIFLAMQRFTDDVNKAREQNRFNASSRGGKFSNTTKRAKRIKRKHPTKRIKHKHPTKRIKHKHAIKRKRNTISKRKVSKQ